MSAPPLWVITFTAPLTPVNLPQPQPRVKCYLLMMENNVSRLTRVPADTPVSRRPRVPLDTLHFPAYPHPVQTAMQEPSTAALPAKPRPSKRRPTPEQRAAFYTALDNGVPAYKAAQMVGVSRPTGDSWAKLAKMGKAEQEARRGLIATKSEFAAKLTEIALRQPDVAPRDQVNAIATASKLLGYDAPTRTESIVINASVEQWIEAQRQAAILTQAAPAKALPPMPSQHESMPQQQGPGGPPIEARAEPISDPSNISHQPAGSSRLPREAGMETALPPKPEGTR